MCSGAFRTSSYVALRRGALMSRTIARRSVVEAKGRVYAAGGYACAVNVCLVGSKAIRKISRVFAFSPLITAEAAVNHRNALVLLNRRFWAYLTPARGRYVNLLTLMGDSSSPAEPGERLGCTGRDRQHWRTPAGVAAAAHVPR
jgi:hypothetical protein